MLTWVEKVKEMYQSAISKTNSIQKFDLLEVKGPTGKHTIKHVNTIAHVNTITPVNRVLHFGHIRE